MTDGRGGGRPAPPTPGAPARRAGAAAVLAGAVLLATWGQGRLAGAPPGPGYPPPFTPGPLEATTGDGRATSLTLRGGAVVLYVDDGCPFCAEELRRWYAASRGAAPEGLEIVRHPGEGVPHPGVVPPAWSARAMVDRTGAIAKGLGVTGVPFLAVADSAGTVVEATLGLTDEERIEQLLTTLAQRQGKGPRHD